jgi:hypothetical protein
MRFDTSMENLIGIGRSESYVDLNNPDFARTLMSSTGNLFAAATGTYLS